MVLVRVSLEADEIPRDCVPGAVASQSLTVLQRLIHRMEVPVMAFDLTADHGCFGNAAMSALMGIPWPVPQEMWLTEIEAVAGTSTAAQIKQSLSALRSGLMRSYQGDRSYVDCRGNPIRAHHSVTRLDLCDGPSMAIAVIAKLPPGTEQASISRPRQPSPVLVTLDHGWTVDALSPDAGPHLRIDTAELLGSSMLDHTHPDDQARLAAAFGRVADMEVVRLTARLGADRDWRQADLLVGSLCPHRPHRIGVVVTLLPEVASESTTPSSPAVTRFRAELAPQQQRVLAQLLEGESVASIAASLHLSRSTVRNHLCALYAKAGVHSQAELLAFVAGRRSSR